MNIQQISIDTTIVDNFSISQGGTGALTQSAALAALNGVPASNLGLPSGPAKLNSSGVVDPNIMPVTIMGAVSIIGPTTTTTNTPTIYTIDDFDSFITYKITTINSATVTQVDDVLTFTCPNAGVGGFYINGKLVKITVS